MIDLYPTTCNLCNGKVIYISNAKIYGRQYGSGYCYYCTECGAYVGTHKPWPRKVMGILADAAMRNMKVRCHALFDPLWMNTGAGRTRRRNKLYARLADLMGISVSDCHFGYFTIEQLRQAYEILNSGKMEEQ